jgi:hypothetical protein
MPYCLNQSTCTYLLPQNLYSILEIKAIIIAHAYFLRVYSILEIKVIIIAQAHSPRSRKSEKISLSLSSGTKSLVAGIQIKRTNNIDNFKNN